MIFRASLRTYKRLVAGSGGLPMQMHSGVFTVLDLSTVAGAASAWALLAQRRTDFLFKSSRHDSATRKRGAW